jgi:hypothetical protein
VVAQEVLVELAQAREAIAQGREPGSWDMDGVWRPLEDHDLLIAMADHVVAALEAGPFHAAVGSFCLVGQVMH